MGRCLSQLKLIVFFCGSGCDSSYKYGTNVLAACHLNYLKSAVWPDEVRSLFTLCLDASYPKSVLLHMT